MALSDAEVATIAALAGADIVARTYGSRQMRLAKSATDFATQTDLDAEAAILDVLASHRPDDARISEESGIAGDQDARRRWLIDPLCGTLNFAATTPLVAINVALVADGTALAAAVVDPIARELFWTDGVNAYCRRHMDDQILTSTADSNLVEINCDGPLNRPFVGGQLLSDPRLRKVYSPRVISSTLSVAWVAAGRRAAYVSDGRFRDNVHFAAGIAVCGASGCVISGLDGRPLHAGRGLIISANQETHDQMLFLVEPHLRAVRTSS